MNVSELTKQLLSSLGDRQKRVLEGRYGLTDGSEMTLASLGKKIGVTRERVRQIQNIALEELYKNREKNGVAEFGVLIKNHLRGVGGVREERALFQDLRTIMSGKQEEKSLDNQFQFLLSASRAALYHGADHNTHAFWYSDEHTKENAWGFIDNLQKTIASKKKSVLEEGRFDEYLVMTAKASGIPELVATNCLCVSKKFAANRYGDIGLSSWPEVHPKSARDWAYLVLYKERKPLHFTLIATRVNELRARKRTNIQTVHNELIKDKRFVLIGRGIYGLREFGLIEGTAREVMTAFLKKHGPLSSKNLIQLVLAQRIFKENTLLLNLQKKTHFKRLSDGRYDVKEV